MEKLSKTAIFKAVLIFIVSIVVLEAVIFAMPAARLTSGFFDYVKENLQSVIVVAVAIPVLYAIMYFYFGVENRSVLAQPKKLFEIFFLFTVVLILCYFIGEYVDLGMYVKLSARPLALFAIMAVTLFTRRDAVFLNCLFSIMLLLVDRFYWYVEQSFDIVGITTAYSCFLVVFCVGLMAVFSFHHIRTRITSVALAFVFFLPDLMICSVLLLPMAKVTTEIILKLILSCALGCIFSVVLYMFLLPVFELLFAELTGFRLRELTSDSAKLIKRLKKNALGTYNHSVVVAQLAEACASAIGEDPERARVAAYYHDVGKLKNPEYFTENKTEGDKDPHSEITPELSVDIIRSHTRDGAKLIRRNRLPDFLADIAVQHHGTLPIKFFYAKALKMSDGELNMDSYSYGGPTPKSKIAAIIMIADASEAATRSLSDRSPANVEALVRSLIEERIDLEQFTDCDITMRELTVIKTTIVDQLTGVYHSRIAYPKLTIKKKK